MSFKYISYLELCRPFCSVERNHICNFGRGNYVEQFCEFIPNLGQLFQRRCCLNISYLELWWPLCSVDWNHLCNFERGHHVKHSCEVIWNFDQWFRRCRLKIFLIWSSGGLYVQWSGTICAISVEAIIKNNSVNLLQIWVSYSGGDVV